MEKTYRLIAVSGDFSATGMSNKAHIIPIPESQVALVNEYLIAEYYANEAFMYDCKQGISPSTPETQDLIKRAQELTTQMFDEGIFNSKYQARTGWAFMELPDYVDPEDVIEEA